MAGFDTIGRKPHTLPTPSGPTAEPHQLTAASGSEYRAEQRGCFLCSGARSSLGTGFVVRKQAIAGWVISLAGTALWLYGYYVTGHAPFIDWQVHTPWWIADFLPNRESEIGMAVICVGSALTSWPPKAVKPEPHSDAGSAEPR